MISVRSLVTGLALAGLLVFPASAETLQDALVAAYNNNPQLLAQRAQVRATDESVPQALGGWRPTVSLTGQAGRQHSENNLRESTTSPRSVTGQISQPLFRGGRTTANISQAESNVLAARAFLHQTEQTILNGVVAAYMNVLRDQAIVELNRNNESVLSRQLQATRDRFEVGELTRTDTAQAESRLSGATTTRIQAENNLIASRAVYQRLVGSPPGELAPAPAITGLPATQQDAINIALDENPTVVQAEYVEEASRHAVRSALGVLLPTVSLNASAGRSDGNSNTTGAANANTGATDTQSITAQVSVPLYQSGSEYAAVRAAKETNSQRRIEIDVQRRQAIENTIRAWSSLLTATDRIRSGADQVRAAEVALDGVRQESDVGSRTTLDVLNAEQELLNARVALVIAERDEYVAAFDLRSAIGRLTAAQLALPVEVYDPAIHYRAVRNKLFGLSTPDEQRSAVR